MTNLHYCPFCEQTFSEFLPVGSKTPVLSEKKIVGGGYRNALCPYCYSIDRERLFYLYIKYKTNVLEPDKNIISLLHIAPEENLLYILKNTPNINYQSADLNPTSDMIKVDITNICFEENFFDIIICSHVLEHVTDDRKAMKEILRVLRPSGWAIIHVPVSLILSETFEDPSIISPEEREMIYGQSDHVRIYGKDYQHRLEEVGFEVKIFNFALEMGSSQAKYYGISENEDLYICSKNQF